MKVKINNKPSDVAIESFARLLESITRKQILIKEKKKVSA